MDSMKHCVIFYPPAPYGFERSVHLAHNQVLRVTVEAIETKVDDINPNLPF